MTINYLDFQPKWNIRCNTLLPTLLIRIHPEGTFLLPSLSLPIRDPGVHPFCSWSSSLSFIWNMGQKLLTNQIVNGWGAKIHRSFLTGFLCVSHRRSTHKKDIKLMKQSPRRWMMELGYLPTILRATYNSESLSSLHAYFGFLTTNISMCLRELIFTILHTSL